MDEKKIAAIITPDKPKAEPEQKYIFTSGELKEYFPNTRLPTISEVKRRQMLAQQERRISEIDNIISRLYEDNINGKLTDERFIKMSTDYEREQASLRESAEKLRQAVEACNQQNVNMDSFLKLVKKYTVPDKLFPEILHAFVKKIVVHAPDKSNGHRTQQIDIHYNFIGEIGLSQAIDKKEPA